jgi:heat shock protein HtpX
MSSSATAFPRAIETRGRERYLVAPVVFIALSALIFAALGALFGQIFIGALVGIAVAIVLTVIAFAKADAVVLRVSNAMPASEIEHRRLHNVVEGLCVTIGLQKPDVYVVRDDALNALVVGAGGRSSVVFTTGLINNLDRIQIEGVVAHLLSRIRGGQVQVLARVAVLIGAPVLLCESLQRKKWPVSSLLVAVGVLVGPFMKWLMGNSTVIEADLAACRLTRYPPGLTQGLETLSLHSTRLHSSSFATTHLWFADPISREGDASRQVRLHNLFAVHSPLGERIALLKEL